MKKSMEKPFVKVVKMEAVDICTASGDVETNRPVSLESMTYKRMGWQN